MSELIIGAHQSIAGPRGVLGSVQDAIADGSSTLMVYLTAPSSTARRAVSDLRLEEAWEAMERGGIDITKTVVHAPYLINLATNDDAKGEFSTTFFKGELTRAKAARFSRIVLHPGSHSKTTPNQGIDRLARRLQEILADPNIDVLIALETMSGKGSEIGVNLEELAMINWLVNDPRVGFCLDTCHLHDSGVDLDYFDDYLEQFEKLVGLDKIFVVHVNDSLNPRGSHKDRHANLGFGTIGYQTLLNIIYHPKLKDVPKILETPYVGDRRPYGAEIKAVRERRFNPDLLTSLAN